MNGFFENLIHEFELPLANPVLIFALILLIILLSPILFRRLNIPGIIVLILSGVIVGPYGLGILEKNSAVELFSTIGLLYIMFIAGLELDMNEFRLHRNKSLLFGFFTFFFPLAIGYPVCYYLLGYDVNASMLTAIMFSTHTLVAYPIVSKVGVSKNPAVAIVVGGTILADTLALIVLAVILGNSQGNLSIQFWVRLGASLAAFSVVMFLFVPRVAKWFFQKMESEKQAHYIFVLSVVFLAAFLAEVAGVEPIIGAFVAGLALNKIIPPSSALMNRIEFIGNALFIPFFLISVGMLVDVRVIFSGAGALIVAGVLLVVALSGKWLAALFAQWVFHYSISQRQLIFGLSASRAAATLAIVLVGYEANILDESILNGTIILILITCIVASLITERAAKALVMAMEEDTSHLVKVGNEHILVPFANIGNIEKLIEFSILIKDKNSSHPVSVLSVVSNNREAEINILKARNKLEEFVKQASASETKVNVITTIDYNAASGIVRIAREIMADIIVLGWPQRAGILDKLIGDKVSSILTNTDKTLFICHLAKPLALHKRIWIVAPPLAEHENGFERWLTKISKLSTELSVPMLFYCNYATKVAVQKLMGQLKSTAHIDFHFFEDWEEITSFSGKVKDDDLFILISARKGSASFLPLLESLPALLEQHFSSNSRLAIYPQQYHSMHRSETYDDLLANS